MLPNIVGPLSSEDKEWSLIFSYRLRHYHPIGYVHSNRSLRVFQQGIDPADSFEQEFSCEIVSEVNPVRPQYYL